MVEVGDFNYAFDKPCREQSPKKNDHILIGELGYAVLLTSTYFRELERFQSNLEFARLVVNMAANVHVIW